MGIIGHTIVHRDKRRIIIKANFWGEGYEESQAI